MKITRSLMQELHQWFDRPNRKPLILKGARQVGKTHLLKEFGASRFERTHYVNFELTPKARGLFEGDLDPKRIIRDISFLLGHEVVPGRDLLLLDELQLAPLGITSLKYFCEELPNLAVCAAGSLIGLNLGENSFPVGKVEIKTLYPLTFFEFLSATRNELVWKYITGLVAGEPQSELAHEKAFTCLKQFFVCGGMPAIVRLFAENIETEFEMYRRIREEQIAIVEAYMNDFAKHCGKTNSLHLERVFRAIPSQMANQVDSKAHRFKFKDVVPGIAQYAPLASAFDWLVGAGLALRVPIIKSAIPPLNPRVKEGFSKFYLHDVGLLGALADIAVDGILNFDFSNFKGYFAENFVAQELIAKDIRSLYCWREGSSEVEFILDKGSFALPIEVKSGNFRHAKSLRVFMERYNPKKGVMLVGESRGEYSQNRVTVLPIYCAGLISNFF